MISKKAQSEMAGFGIIIIIISVLIIVFISVSLNSGSRSEVQDYQSEAFVQAYLQFTTQCQKNSNFLSTLELIKLCSSNSTCDDNQNACKVLNETSNGILESSWQVGSDFPLKGYDLGVIYQGKELVKLFKGNKTSDSRGSRQTFSESLEVDFTGYY